MKKEMLINVLQPEEIRIAIVEDGVLEELYVERSSHESYVGNIYKGRIVNIEPSIQAAFVDFGVGRNGFLHVSDVEPAYYRHLPGFQDEGRGGGRRSPRDRHRSGDRPEGRGEGRRGGRGRGGRVMDDIPPLPEEFLDEDFEDTPIETPGDEAAAPLTQLDVELDDATEVEPPDHAPAAEPWPSEPDASVFDDHYPSVKADEPAAQDAHQGPPAEAAPDTEHYPGDPGHEGPAEEPRRRGRRRRGKSQGPSRKGGEGEPHGSGPSEPSAPERNPGDEPVNPHDEERPRLMDSAERRTDEDDEPLDPLEPKSPVSDEDLSFSMAPPTTSKLHSTQPAHHDDPDPLDAPGRHPSEHDDRTEPPMADYEQLPLHEEHALPGEPLPAEEFRPVADDLPVPGDEGDRYPVYEEYAPREGRPRDDRDDRGPGERGRGDRGRDERGRDERGRGRDDRGRDDRGRDDRGRRDNRRGGPRGGPRRMGGGRPGFGRPKPPIQEIFKRGQEVLVQVIKEGIGTKGPTLSTYISIAGRYLVLMPGLNRIGVSRKILDDDARRRLRQIMSELQPPRGIGFIIRTAGIDRNKKELQRDLVYLAKLWQVVVRRIKKQKAPCDIYEESDMITRTIRDIFTSDIDTIWVDEPKAFEHAREFLQIVMPRYAERIKLYDAHEPMFHKYGIEQEINRIQQRHVPLPAGGSIVIDQTEALVAIDVNSGSFRADNNAEETAYRMNLQAAKEIARQLRLRDLGGVIVNDFIDMREEKHRRNVERALRDAMKRDRARAKILRMSQFGIIEMTRQRIRPSLKRSVYQDCPHCVGTGQVKTCESMSIEVMRLIQLAIHREYIARLEVRVQDDVAHYLLNRKRLDLARLEETSGKQIQVRGQQNVPPEQLDFMSYDNNGNEVKFLPYDEPPPRPVRRRGGSRRGRDEDR